METVKQEIAVERFPEEFYNLKCCNIPWENKSKLLSALLKKPICEADLKPAHLKIIKALDDGLIQFQNIVETKMSQEKADEHFTIIASGYYLTESFPVDHESYSDDDLLEWMEDKQTELNENIEPIELLDMIYDMRNLLVDAYFKGNTA